MPAVDPFIEAVKAAYTDAQDLLLEKHRYYGPKNISDAPGGAMNGLRVRLHDKLARLNNMLDTGLQTGVGESLKDTARDIANYGIIMTLVLDGDWPGADTPLADVVSIPLYHPNYVDSDGDNWVWNYDHYTLYFKSPGNAPWQTSNKSLEDIQRRYPSLTLTEVDGTASF